MFAFGPKWMIAIVILVMLGTGCYISHLQQTGGPNSAVAASPDKYASLVSAAIADTELSMNKGPKR